MSMSSAGAIQTIMQLLRKPETCSAAITMLGKTVELCAEQVPPPSPTASSSTKVFG